MAITQINLSGIEGLAPRFWGELTNAPAVPTDKILGGSSQMASGIYNPFKKLGYLSPASTTSTRNTTSSGTVDAIIGSTLYDLTNDDYYFAERGQQIWRLDGFTDTTLTQALDLGATGTPVIMDLTDYQVNGVRKMFVTYETAGNMEVAISAFPYNSAADDLTWLSATVSGAFSNGLTGDAFMRIADNGFAYLFQDNNVHKIDGTINGGANGTVSANVLQFPIFFSIVDAVDYRGNMFIATHQNTEDIRGTGTTDPTGTEQVGVYIWDRLTTVLRTSDFIPMAGATEIRKLFVSQKGTLRAIVTNTSQVTEVREFDGSNFVTLTEAGRNAGPKYADSLSVTSEAAVWQGMDGYIYAYGYPYPGLSEGLFIISDALLNGTPSAVLIDNLGGTHSTIRLGSFNGSTYAVSLIHLNTATTTGGGTVAKQAQGDVFTLVKYLPQMSTVNFIEMYMSPSGSGGSTTAATIKIYFNQSSTAWASKTVTYDDVKKGYVRFEIDKPYINSIQIETEYSTANSVSVSEYTPSMAIVDYTPTTTRG